MYCAAGTGTAVSICPHAVPVLACGHEPATGAARDGDDVGSAAVGAARRLRRRRRAAGAGGLGRIGGARRVVVHGVLPPRAFRGVRALPVPHAAHVGQRPGAASPGCGAARRARAGEWCRTCSVRAGGPSRRPRATDGLIFAVPLASDHAPHRAVGRRATSRKPYIHAIHPFRSGRTPVVRAHGACPAA